MMTCAEFPQLVEMQPVVRHCQGTESRGLCSALQLSVALPQHLLRRAELIISLDLLAGCPASPAITGDKSNTADSVSDPHA